MEGKSFKIVVARARAWRRNGGHGRDDNDDSGQSCRQRRCGEGARWKRTARHSTMPRTVHSLDFSRLGWSATELDELFLSLLASLASAAQPLRNTSTGTRCAPSAHAWPNGVVKTRPLDVDVSCELGAEAPPCWHLACSSPALADRTQSRRQLHHKRGRPVHRRRAHNGASCMLRRLNLDTNEIRTEGAEAIGIACAHHSSLTDLSLRDNLLKDEGAIALAAALSHRRPWGKRHRLRALDVRSNGIGERGAQALANCHLGDGLQIGVVIHLARTASGRFKVPGL